MPFDPDLEPDPEACAATARALRSGPRRLRLNLASYDIMTQETLQANALGYYPGLLCQLTFPASPVKGSEYVRHSGMHHLSILVPEAIGIPSGAYPRAVMSWFTREIKLRQKDDDFAEHRTLKLGNNLLSFMTDVTGTTSYSGGEFGNIKPFRRQLASTLASQIFYWYGAQPEVDMKYSAMQLSDEGTLLWMPRSAEAPALFQSTVVITEKFRQEVIQHAVPDDVRALRGLWPNCLCIDIYRWLNQRVHFWLSDRRHAVMIPWPMLKLQFGPGYHELKQFRYKFLLALGEVRSVFPSLEFIEEPGKGITFKFKRRAVLAVTVLANGDAKVGDITYPRKRLSS